MSQLLTQFVNLLGAVLLLLAFAMIAQRRIVSLINLFTLQGATLALVTAVVGYVTHQHDLYLSAGLTFVLKVVLIPYLLIGIGVVIFSFNLALPISRLSTALASGTLGIALACVLLSFLMMITRAKAVPQVIGFLAVENGLFFAATSATYGMPMVVELGIGLDVLIGVFILGVFMFQIREQFDSLDIRHLEKLKED